MRFPCVSPALAALALAVALTGCGEKDFDEAAATGPATAPVSTVVAKNSLPSLMEAAGLVTFRTALARAYLADSLEGQGPFTVFVPTDGAFEARSGESPQELLRPTNRERLRALVAYHIVPGALTSDDIQGTRMVRTYGGGPLALQRRGDEIVLAGGQGTTARVFQADLEAENGVIHVIDGVLLPPPPGDTTAVPVLLAPDSTARAR